VFGGDCEFGYVGGWGDGGESVEEDGGAGVLREEKKVICI
jgi:hypothetical protein